MSKWGSKHENTNSVKIRIRKKKERERKKERWQAGGLPPQLHIKRSSQDHQAHQENGHGVLLSDVNLIKERK